MSRHDSFNKDNYDDLRIRVEKGKKDKIKAHAEAHDHSLNGFVVTAVDEKMERDIEQDKAIGTQPTSPISNNKRPEK